MNGAQRGTRRGEWRPMQVQGGAGRERSGDVSDVRLLLSGGGDGGAFAAGAGGHQRP
jgi:hypothetical protein